MNLFVLLTLFLAHYGTPSVGLQKEDVRIDRKPKEQPVMTVVS